MSSGARSVADVAWWRSGQKRGLLTDCTTVMGFSAFTSAGVFYWYETMAVQGRNSEQLNECLMEFRDNGCRDCPRLHGACML